MEQDNKLEKAYEKNELPIGKKPKRVGKFFGKRFLLKKTARRVVTVFLAIAVGLTSFNFYQKVEAAGSLTKVEEWTTSPGDGFEMKNEIIYKVKKNMTLGSSSSGTNGLKVAPGARAVLFIPDGVTLTVYGKNGTGRDPGYAAIYLPSNSEIVITGSGALNIYGGNAGNSGNGENGFDALWQCKNSDILCMYRAKRGPGGAGGDGGGGAAAGIGGNGGTGGKGGERSITVYDLSTRSINYDGVPGHDGTSGGSGTSAGTVYTLGSTSFSGRGGIAGTAGQGGPRIGAPYHDSSGWGSEAGGGGAGGGGGSTFGAQIIGAGTGGAGGGGSGSGGGWEESFTIFDPADAHPGMGGNAGDGGTAGASGKPNDKSNGKQAISGYGGERGNPGTTGLLHSSHSVIGDRNVDVSIRTVTDLQYISSFDNTGGQSDPVNEPITQTLGVVDSTKLIIPDKVGHDFLGYYSEADETGIEYYNAKGQATREWDFVEDKTLYAHWKRTIFKYITPEIDPKDGIQATVEFTPKDQAKYKSQVIGKVTLSGVAERSGVHVISLTSPIKLDSEGKAIDGAGDDFKVSIVVSLPTGGSTTATNTASFEMPEYDISNMTLTHEVITTPDIYNQTVEYNGEEIEYNQDKLEGLEVGELTYRNINDKDAVATTNKPVDASEYEVFIPLKVKVSKEGEKDLYETIVLTRTLTITPAELKWDVEKLGVEDGGKKYDGNTWADLFGTLGVEGILAIDDDKVQLVNPERKDGQFEDFYSGKGKIVYVNLDGFGITGERASNYQLPKRENPPELRAEIIGEKAAVIIKSELTEKVYNEMPQEVGDVIDFVNPKKHEVILDGKNEEYVTYTYYTDKDFAFQTQPDKDGCLEPGKAPRNAGKYWIQATYKPPLENKQFQDTISGIEPTKEVVFVIKPKPIIDEVVVEWKNPQGKFVITDGTLSHVYTGNELKPKVEVYTNNSDQRVKLYAGQDYDINYTDNKNAGNSGDENGPKAIITLNNDYDAVIVKPFTITKAEYDLNDIKMEDQAFDYDKRPHGLEIDDINALLNLDINLKVNYFYKGISGEGADYGDKFAPSEEGIYEVEATITTDSDNHVFTSGEDGSNDKEIKKAKLTIEYVDKDITFNFAEGLLGPENDTEETWLDAHQYTLMKDHQPNGVPKPTKVGYDLAGWNNSGIFYTGESLGDIEIQDDNLYTAVWEPIMVNVKFDANGGKFDDTEDKGLMNIEQKFGTDNDFSHVSVPKKQYSDFKGWGLTEDATEIVTENKFKFDKDKTYYAVWETEIYDIKFHYNGGVNPENNPFADIKVTNGDKIGGTIEIPTYSGRSLTGWVNLSGDSELLTTAQIEEISPKSDATFLAQWDGENIEIEFTGFNEGAGEIQYKTPILNEGHTAIEPLITPKTGDEFLHWIVTASDDTSIEKDKTYTSNALKSLKIMGNVTFKAVFTDKIYKVNFILNEGEFDKGDLNQEIKHGGMAIEPKVSRNNYELTGWINMSTGKLIKTGEIELQTINTDTNFIAQWETEMVKITFDGGEGKPGTRTYDFAKGTTFNIDAISDPVKDKAKFVGWASSEELAQLGVANVKGEQEVIEAKTYYAVYSEKKSEVIFQDDERLVIEKADILFGDKISDNFPSQPKATTKPTAKFADWKMDGDILPKNWNQIKTMVVNEPHIFTAVYKENEYTLTFDVQDGNNGPANITGQSTQTVVLAEYTKPTPADGYIFVDWFDEPTEGTKITEHTLTEDLTVYAQYVEGEASYEVSYKKETLEGGKYEEEISKTFIGMTDTLPASHEIELTGMTFDPSQTTYQIGEDGVPSTNPMNINGDGDLIVNYYYTRNEYLVSYSTSGTENDEVPPKYNTNYKFGEKVILKPKIELEGFGFEGWYAQGVIINKENVTNDKGEEVIEESFTMPAAAVDINAVYTPGLYTVRYEIEELDGTSFVDNNKYEPGDSVTFLKDEPEKAGYEFDHWSYLDQPFDLEAEFEMPGRDVVLKAVWNKVDYTVGYENDNEMIFEEIKMLGDVVTLPKAPVREYSVFKGWEIDGTKYPEGSEYTVVDKTKATFKATWEVERYEITYHLNDGSENETGIYEKGQVNDLGLEAKREGYKFMGWYLDEALSEKAGTLAPEIQDDMDLYAKWEEVIAPAPLPQTNTSGNNNSNSSNSGVVNKAGLTADENAAEKSKDEIKESTKTATDNKSKNSAASSEKVTGNGGFNNFIFPALTLLYGALYALLIKKKKDFE